jgi:hypothetical protein
MMQTQEFIAVELAAHAALYGMYLLLSIVHRLRGLNLELLLT